MLEAWKRGIFAASVGRRRRPLRRRALFLIERGRTTQAEAAPVVGVHRQTVNIWPKRYREQGEDGLLDGRRISPRRGQERLTEGEARQVQGWIAEGTPDRLELRFALWTSRAVRELIERRLERRLGPSTVQLHLKRWGMTPQKPLARARAAQAVIYWGDETGISNHHAAQPHDPAAQLARAEARAGDQIGRSYAPKGQTPVIARTAKRVAQSMISAVGNRGLMRFMLYEGALNADGFIAFLRRLIKDAGRKAVLIVDNLKVHKAGKVTAWVKSHGHEIELYYLRSHAPGHTPTEHLNNDLKQKLRQQPQPGSKEELIRSARSVPRAIQRSPRRVRAYFKPKPVRYAA